MDIFYGILFYLLYCINFWGSTYNKYDLPNISTDVAFTDHIILHFAVLKN